MNYNRFASNIANNRAYHSSSILKNSNYSLIIEKEYLSSLRLMNQLNKILAGEEIDQEFKDLGIYAVESKEREIEEKFIKILRTTRVQEAMRFLERISSSLTDSATLAAMVNFLREATSMFNELEGSTFYSGSE